MVSDTYEIYAVRYAHHERRARDNFYGGDPHDGPMPLDYFVWAIRNDERTLVFDTGFDAAMAAKRRREFLRPPRDGLMAIGVDPATVKDVVISHMHYDHAGNHDLFPNATFHLQDREMAFCTGRCMCHADLRRSFEADDVAAMVGRVFAGRVQFHDGDDEIAPGITAHHVGGHTAGLQFLRVKTARGWVVLASDAAHFYANFEQMRAYATVYNVGDMLEGFARLKRLATSPQHVIPGHDPLVLRRYSPPQPALEGLAVRLDVPPREG
ncbi:MAG TPA: N-acyl homoserine lactonase family protein [Stellaceae bacterium]|nr:N-acyl homoserine lactonase family protein [Stellaceae bacterium]